MADINTKGIHIFIYLYLLLGLDQYTALHFAANENQVEVIKELLTHPDLQKEAGSSINRTPLHLAAIRGYVQVV